MYEIDAGLLDAARRRIAGERQWEVTLELRAPTGAELRGAEATVTLTRHAFRFGCNGFSLTRIEDAGLRAAYEERFAALLNYATLPFYWGSYEPERRKTMENTVRGMAAWCRERNIATKGHPLVWHEVFPRWAVALPDEEALALQRARITALVCGFKGLVDTWDVVNEATVSQRFDNAVGRWVARQGAGAVVTEALRLAHTANPDAELLYNDFNVRAPECAALVGELLARDAPMRAIGIQSHMHARTWPLAEAVAITEQYAAFGRPLHYTELTVLSGRAKDVNDRDWHTVHTDWPSTPEGEAAQAAYGEAFYTLLYSHPAVEAITWWDFSDYQAWQGAPAGLIRADMSSKPLYDRLMELVWKEWATHVCAPIMTERTLTVRCAAGKHHAAVTLPSGATLTGEFWVAKGDRGPVAVELA